MVKVYNCIVKLNNEKWVTYRKINNLIRFVKFLDNEKQWLFFNVYDNLDKSNSNNILASFQNGENRNIPTSRHL
ncbi:MAG: hypothetical protein HC854_15605 [Flavobacterium sp.]|nr:hypothetical protein [Flavobacterium sp.]